MIFLFKYVKKMKARQKKTAQKRTVAVKKTDVKIVEVKEYNPVDQLSSYKNKEGKNIISEDQAKLLFVLRTKSDKPLIDINKVVQIHQLLLRIQNFGFDTIYSDLIINSTQNRTIYVSLDEYFMKYMRKQRLIFVQETVQGLIIEKTEKGVFKCEKCLRENRDPNNTKSISHTHRGDEASKNIVTCNTCNTKWTAK